MPIYFIFIIVAIVIAIFSEKIDEKINANGKLRRAVTIFCILFVITLFPMLTYPSKTFSSINFCRNSC